MKKLIISITFLLLFSVSIFALPNGRYYWCKDGLMNATATYDINGDLVKVDFHEGAYAGHALTATAAL